MDFKKVENTVKKSESLINTIWGVLARNWGKLIVLILIAGAVWFSILVIDEIENPSEDPDAYDEHYEEDPDYYDDYTEDE